MAWRRNPQNLSHLQELGFLTARLLRINAFTKLARGEAQLRATGAPVQLTGAYKEYVRNETVKIKPKKAAIPSESFLVVDDKSEL